MICGYIVFICGWAKQYFFFRILPSVSIFFFKDRRLFFSTKLMHTSSAWRRLSRFQWYQHEDSLHTVCQNRNTKTLHVWKKGYWMFCFLRTWVPRHVHGLFTRSTLCSNKWTLNRMCLRQVKHVPCGWRLQNKKIVCSNIAHCVPTYGKLAKYETSLSPLLTNNPRSAPSILKRLRCTSAPLTNLCTVCHIYIFF